MIVERHSSCDRAAPCSANVHWFEAGKRLCVADVTALWFGKAVANMGVPETFAVQMVAWSAQFPRVVDTCFPIGC